MDRQGLVEEISLESSKKFIGGITGKGLDYLLVLLLARHLQPTQYGVYTTAFIFTAMMVTVSRFGLDSGTTHFVSRALSEDRERELAGVYLLAIGTTVVTAALVAGAAIAAAPWISEAVFDSEQVTVLTIFFASVPFRILLQVSLSLFDGFNDMGTRVTFEVARDGLQVLVVLALTLLEASMVTIVLGVVLVIVCMGVVSAVSALERLRRFGPVVDIGRIRTVAREMFAYSVPLWLVAIANLGRNWVDVLLLSYLTTSDIVGIYQIAWTLAGAFSVLLVAFATPFFPMASRLYAQSEFGQLKRLFQLVTRWINLLVLPVFLFSFVFAEPIITLFFGSEYAAAVPIARVSLVGMFIHVSAGNNIALLKGLDNTRLYLYVATGTLVVNIALNLLLIPEYGGVGAAAATAFSLGLLNAAILSYVYLRYDIWGYSPLRSYLTFGTAGVVAIVPIWFAHGSLPFHVALLSPLYAGVYFGLVALQNGFTDEDKFIVHSGVNRLNPR